MDIPTIVVNPGSYITMDGLPNMELDERQLADDFFSKGIKLIYLKDLNKTIYQQLENPDELKKERKQAVKDFGGNIKDPIKKTISTIKKIYDKYN